MFSFASGAEVLMVKFSSDGLADGEGELYADSQTLRRDRGRCATVTLVSVPS